METVTNHVNRSNFVPAADLISRTGFTAAQNESRSGDIVNLTVMAKDSDGNLIPLTDNTAVDGTQIPVGILRGTIPEADLKADDVSNVEMYIAGKYFNEDDITLENSLTLESEITVDTYTANVATADAVEIATLAQDDAVEIVALAQPDTETGSNFEAYTVALLNEVKSVLNTYINAGKTTALVNEIKSALNTYTTAGKTTALVNALKTAVNTKTGGRTMTIREYLNMIGFYTRAVDAVGGYENS
jgi:hypothetical protein